MSTEENKGMIHRFWNEVSKGNLDIWDELCAPGYIYHGPAGDMTREQSKQHAAGILSTFSDFKCTIYDIVAEGDRVANRYIMRGTHQGAYGGIAPTGKQVEISGIEIDRIADGKFAETWGISDTFVLMRQLGTFSQ